MPSSGPCVWWWNLLDSGATPTEIQAYLVDSELVPVTIRIPRTLRDSAKEAAALSGLTFTALVKMCLIEDVVKAGVRTKVLMLSATPVNNKLLDLRNQIELITEGDDAYLADTDGIPSITHVTRVAQQRFNEWSKLADEDRTTGSFVVLR